MTYRELLEKLHRLDEKDLDTEVFIYVSYDDKFYEVELKRLSDNTPFLNSQTSF